MRSLLVGINSKYIHTSLGIRCVAEYAKSKGYAVDILEESINTPILQVLDKLMAEDWDVYGFSMHIWSRTYVERLVALLRRVKPKVKVVLGGPEVTQVQHQSELYDYLIDGEGEEKFCEYLTSLNPSSVTLHPSSVEYPLPYPDIDEVKAQHKIFYYEASRGCPFRCSYCLSSVDHRVRQKPLQVVLDDLHKFISADVPLVKFVDRTFNLDEKFYLAIMRELAAADCHTTFHFEIKADLLSEEVLQFLATVPKGRFQFEVGIQSTHADTLTAINRSNDWAKLRENCQRIISYGNIHLHTDLIAGLPYEGLQQWRQSFNDVYAIGAPMLQLGFLKVLPGTEMAKRAEEYDLVYMPEPPYEVLATKWLSYDELKFLRKFDKIFDVVHNGGHFPNYLAALIQEFAEPYLFYKHLVDNWQGEGNITVNAKTVAYGLFQIFGQQHIDLLQKDIYQHISNWKPDWLDWSNYTRRKRGLTE